MAAVSAGPSPVLLMATSLSLLGLASLLLSWEISLVELESSWGRREDFSPPFQDASSQDTPVKLLTENGLRVHLRHGLPDRSSALRLALIAPALVLGPNLWPAPVALPGFEV